MIKKFLIYSLLTCSCTTFSFANYPVAHDELTGIAGVKKVLHVDSHKHSLALKEQGIEAVPLNQEVHKSWRTRISSILGKAKGLVRDKFGLHSEANQASTKEIFKTDEIFDDNTGTMISNNSFGTVIINDSFSSSAALSDDEQYGSVVVHSNSESLAKPAPIHAIPEVDMDEARERFNKAKEAYKQKVEKAGEELLHTLLNGKTLPGRNWFAGAIVQLNNLIYRRGQEKQKVKMPMAQEVFEHIAVQNQAHSNTRALSSIESLEKQKAIDFLKKLHISNINMRKGQTMRPTIAESIVARAISRKNHTRVSSDTSAFLANRLFNVII